MKCDGLKIMALALVSVMVAMVFGCSSECYENRNALPLAEFYVADDSGRVEQKVSLDSVEVVGIGVPGDSILWDGGTMQSLYLPFRTDSDTTGYRFTDMRTGAYDVITFVYTRSPRFVSAECGVSFVYGIQEIYTIGSLIDSVTCPTGEITSKNIENLKIYLRHE